MVYSLRKIFGSQGGIDYVMISFFEVKIVIYIISDHPAVSLILLRVVSLWLNPYMCCYSSTFKAVLEWNA